MSDTSAAPAPPWLMQVRLRERLAQHTIATVAELAGEGRLDDAEAVLRVASLSALTSAAQEFEIAVATATAHRPDLTLIDPQRPTLLILFALARVQAAGRATGLASTLRSAGLRLRRSTGGDPVERARDLALASFCFYLARRPDDAIVAAHRGADLLASVGEAMLHRNLTLTAATASDLASVLFLMDEFDYAVRMWRLVRVNATDPRSLPLMQADWGLSVMGMISGSTTYVTPAAREVFAIAEEQLGNDMRVDPWQGMVHVARAWFKLDQLDPEGALVSTRRGLETVPDPYMMGPLVLVHIIALLANGRTSSAASFVKGMDRVRYHVSPDSGLARWRAFASAVVTSLVGNSDDAREHALQIPEGDPTARLARAYVAMCDGDAHTAAALLTEPIELIPRVSAFQDTMRAAVEARVGNIASARSALHRAVGTADQHGVRTWALLLPEPEFAALRRVAAEDGHAFLMEVLPEHSNVDTPVRREPLSQREAEILRLVARGHTNPEIAEQLFISRNTVKFHLAKLFRRLDVSTRAEAAAAGAAMLERSSG